MNNKLFLICPECQIETTLRQHFDGNLFFLTSLGTSFSREDFEGTDDVCDLIERENILELFIVNDTSCRFLREAIATTAETKTAAHRHFARLYGENAAAIESAGSLENKAVELARLHMAGLSDLLQESRNIGQKLASGNLRLTAMLYDRQSAAFSEIGVPA